MANNTYAMAINYNAGGQFASNILHYQFDDGGFTNTASAASALCNAFNTNCIGSLRDCLSTHVSVLSLRAHNVTAPGGFEGALLLTGANAGTRTGNLMAAGVGPVEIFLPNSEIAVRGRMFLPGISDSDCVDGVMTAAYLTVLSTKFATIITPFALVGGGNPTATPVIFTRKPAKVSHVISIAYTSMNLGQVRRRQVPA